MPSDADLRAAFKESEGREPNANELQDLRAAASEHPGAKADPAPTKSEIKQALQEELGREPTP